jgi:hypothetical protein
VRTHYTYYLISDWPWLRCLGNEIDSCSVNQLWSLNTEQRLNLCSPYSGFSISTFCFWASSVRGIYLSWMQHTQLYLEKWPPQNYWHLIKIVLSVFKKIMVVCFGAHLKGHWFGDAMFIFMGHRPMTDKWIWIKSVQTFRGEKGKAICSRPWRPIGLWDIEAPTCSR